MIKAKVIGDYWIKSKLDSSSGGTSVNKLIEWNNDEYDFEIYIDRSISQGVNSSFPNKLAWIVESRQVVPDVIDYVIANQNLLKQSYKHVFTCQEDLVRRGSPFSYMISNAGPYIKEKKMYPKTKMVSMIASTKDFLPGHRERLEWVKRLRGAVDLYGSGRPSAITCKEDGLIDYMFSVAMENDYSDSYFTQTLTDCFATATIPIYRGSRKVIERYFDINGVIFFESTEQVRNLTQDDYYSRIKSVETNLAVVQDFISSEDFFTKEYLT